jgi:hypothetical protein
MDQIKQLDKLVKEIGFTKIAIELGYKTDVTIRQWLRKKQIPTYRENDLSVLFSKIFTTKKKAKTVIRKNPATQSVANV